MPWELWDRVDDAEVRSGTTKDDLLIDACDALAAADRAGEAVALLDCELQSSTPDQDEFRRLCFRICRAMYQEM